MGNIFLQAFLSYIEKNPQVVEQLVAKLVPSIIDAIISHNSKPAA
jgi:hypothetical protein